MLQLYSALTAIIAFTGCVSLVMSGEVNPFMSLTAMGLVPGYYRVLKGRPQAPGWVIGVFSVLTLLIFFVDSFIISKDYFLGIAHLTIIFQAIKSFDLKEPWDNLQVYFMSLLQLIVTSELTHSIVFGVIFIFFLVALVAAMVLAHFVKEGTALKTNIKKPVIFISFLTLLITIVFFLSTPRVSGGLWVKGHAKSIKTVGFSEKVDFGSFGEVGLDPTIVMRIELIGNVKGAYYWRGMTLNYFDGISWKDTLKEKTWVYKEEGQFNIKSFKKEQAVIQRVFLEPMDTDIIFGLSNIAAVEAKGRILFMDNAGALFLPIKKGKSFDYIVYSVQDMPVFKEGKNDYLQLPSGIDRISELAHNITNRKNNDRERAVTIERFLGENYTYSFALSPPPEGISPIEDFLFISKKGYCEHYATAMVLMLRSLGIPARIVTGFSGGEMNEYGGYIIVRQSNAHSWVEAVIDGKWRRFDPTPPVLLERPSALSLFIDMLRMKWDRYVVAFSLSDQKKIIKTFSMPFTLRVMPDFRFHGFRGILYILLPALGIVLILFLVGHLQLKKHGFITAQYIRLRNILKNKGAKIKPSSTPSDVKKEAIQLGIDTGVTEFIKLYEDHRFGGKDMRGEDRARYKSLIKEIDRHIKT
jgi:transglutaminase-like putative cysteine protease